MTTTERMFPGLKGPSVPWRIIAMHEPQAMENHDQTLERLAQRGGLRPSEMVAVLEDRKWRSMPDDEARKRLFEIVDQHSPKFAALREAVIDVLVDALDMGDHYIVNMQKLDQLKEVIQ